MINISHAIIVIFLFFSAGQSSDSHLKEADALFKARDNIESLKQAMSIAERAAATSPPSYDWLWRLAKFRYYLADRESSKDQRAKLFQAGADAARKAIAADPSRVEAHFWLGANTGELADLKGALQSLGLVRMIRKEFETALSIDPNYARGTTHLALAQMDLRLPRLFGGNDRRGLERLESGLKVGPDNDELKIALAEVYLKKGRTDEARKLLQSILTDDDPLRTPLETRDLRAKAKQKLDEIK
jgi:tetratricopeptide (TPR) repeat protein